MVSLGMVLTVAGLVVATVVGWLYLRALWRVGRR